MYRFIEKRLLEWKNHPRRKPLLIRGARQVGKTYSVLDFGKKYFKGKTIHLDLEKRTDLHLIFQPDLDARRIVSDLEIALSTRITPGEDLLFLDEIQSCPRALAALRYFYEDLPDLHIIAAGSLLDFAFEDFHFPVGRVQFLEMRPMSFVEYLLAMGNEQAVAVINQSNMKISPAAHEMLLNLLRRYLFVGGMPECVKVQVETASLTEVFECQRSLIESFKDDFGKYSPKADRYCLEAVMINSARSIGNQIVYTKLADGFSGPTIKKAFDLLRKARLVHKVRAASPAGIPLGATASERKFKALFLDIGLMQQFSGIQISEEYYKKDLLGIYQGKLAEQFVGQELLAAGVKQLYYWAREARSSTAEVDYLIEKDGNILPIEVKSGPTGKLKSLHLLLKSYPQIPKGLVVSSAPHGFNPEHKIEFIPLYALSRLVGDTR